MRGSKASRTIQVSPPIFLHEQVEGDEELGRRKCGCVMRGSRQSSSPGRPEEAQGGGGALGGCWMGARMEERTGCLERAPGSFPARSSPLSGRPWP